MLKVQQTRFVGLLYIPTLVFLDYHAPVDGNPLLLSLILVFYACGRKHNMADNFGKHQIWRNGSPVVLAKFKLYAI